MNIYSSELFLDIVSSVYFPTRKTEVVWAEIDGAVYQTLLIDNKRLLGGVPFMEYLEPVSPSQSGQFRRISAQAMPLVCQQKMAIQALDSLPEHSYNTVAPFLDLSEYESFDDLKKGCQAVSSRAFGKTMRQRKNKIHNDFQEVAFVPSLPVETALAYLDQLMVWKLARYDHRECGNVLHSALNQTFVRALVAAGIMTVSAITVDDQPMAVDAHFEWEGQLNAVLTGYDPQFYKYSPGGVLTEYLLEYAFEAGMKEFDFSTGAQAYKSIYCTQMRVIGPSKAGANTVSFGAKMRRWVADGIRKVPVAYTCLRRLKLALEDRRGPSFVYGE